MNPATKGIQYDPSYDTKGKAMTVSNGLPKEYEDWVEASHLPGTSLDHIIVTATEYVAAGLLRRQLDARYFVPPKPKPTLPDVKPGAVVRYVDTVGNNVRAVRRGADHWDIFAAVKPYNKATNRFTFTDQELLNDVNADGFTVELDGL